jgi:hypothetical protein
MGASRKAPWRRKRKGEGCISDGGGIILLELRSRSLNLNSVNQLIFVMVKCGVLFEVRTEFLNNI